MVLAYNKSNPLKADPTRTAALRRRFAVELRKRFRLLKQRLAKLLVEEDALGLVMVNSVTNVRWANVSNPDKIKQFGRWLKRQIDTTIRGMSEEQLWQRYVEEGFRKGAGRAFDDVTKQRTGALPAGDFYKGSRDDFLRSSFGKPVAVEKVKLLAGRSFNDLKGVTDAMARRMTRDLADGLVRGQSPREIAGTLVEDVAIGSDRAETIARTEIIRAHAEGQLEALENLGVEELGVLVEWSTTGDELVCPLCEDMEGQTFTLEEAHGMLPLHPS